MGDLNQSNTDLYENDLKKRAMLPIIGKFDIPIQMLLLIAIMIDNPKSRSLTLEQISNFDILSVIIRYLKIGASESNTFTFNLLSASVLCLSVLLRFTSGIATSITKISNLLEMIDVPKI